MVQLLGVDHVLSMLEHTVGRVEHSVPESEDNPVDLIKLLILGVPLTRK